MCVHVCVCVCVCVREILSHSTPSSRQLDTACVCVLVCVYVCVRERFISSHSIVSTAGFCTGVCVVRAARVYVCVCVCVFEKERQGRKERKCSFVPIALLYHSTQSS